MDRILIHFDIDYYFAQIEELRRPETKGKPVVVCIYSGRSRDSGAVSTSNYEARKYGVKAGMPIFQAKQRLKEVDAVFLPADQEFYTKTSAKIMAEAAELADEIEIASIDEAFLEVTKKSEGIYPNAESIAKRIKKTIQEKFGLTCSVGIGPNKLIAKIASDFKKPDGLTVVRKEEVIEFLGRLPVKSIPGIGPKTNQTLEELGIQTIKELRLADRGILVEKFGKKQGNYIIEAANGKDESILVTDPEQRQFSKIITLKKDSRNPNEIMNALDTPIHDLAEEISSKNKTFSVVGIIAIDNSLQMLSKTKKIPHPSYEEIEIRKTAEELFKQLINEVKVEFRRVGVKVEKLEDNRGQKSLAEF